MFKVRFSPSGSTTKLVLDRLNFQPETCMTVKFKVKLSTNKVLEYIARFSDA